MLFFLLLLRPPRSTLFPTRRSSDLAGRVLVPGLPRAGDRRVGVRGAAPEGRVRPLVRRRARLVAPSAGGAPAVRLDRKSTRLNSSHMSISYAVFCLKKKTISYTLPA